VQKKDKSQQKHVTAEQKGMKPVKSLTDREREKHTFTVFNDGKRRKKPELHGNPHWYVKTKGKRTGTNRTSKKIKLTGDKTWIK